MEAHHPPRLCFSDLSELDHVVEILRDLAAMPNPNDIGRIGGSPFPALLSRLNEQEKWQRSISDAKAPGAFDRSYLAAEYAEAWALVHELVHFPWKLPAKLVDLENRLQRIMIAGNLTEDGLNEVLQRLAASSRELTFLRPLAETGMKNRAGGDKGRRNGARSADPERDAAIFEAVEKYRTEHPRQKNKSIFPEVGKAFDGIGYEAVKAAIRRHNSRISSN